jgi:hypothetical protein
MDREGPLLQAFNNLPDGVIRQELTSYFMRDGQLVKQTVERTYISDGDYNDSTVVVPLTKS